MMITGSGEQGKMAEFVASTNPLVGDDVPQPGEGPSREAVKRAITIFGLSARMLTATG